MNVPFKVICIDDSMRPADLPTSKWVVKGKQYTVVKMEYLTMDRNTLAFKLAEIDLSDCLPYTHFRASRFGIPIKDLEAVEENSEVKEELQVA